MVKTGLHPRLLCHFHSGRVQEGPRTTVMIRFSANLLLVPQGRALIGEGALIRDGPFVLDINIGV